MKQPFLMVEPDILMVVYEKGGLKTHFKYSKNSFPGTKKNALVFPRIHLA